MTTRSKPTVSSVTKELLKVNLRHGQEPSKRFRSGWYAIAGNSHYFRSEWERKYACYLQWLQGRGDILSWTYEPREFWFSGIKRGTVSYKPDFEVIERNGTVVLHEVKGYMDQRSRTTLKRMRIYHPSVRIVVIGRDDLKDIGNKLGRLVPGWEAPVASTG